MQYYISTTIGVLCDAVPRKKFAATVKVRGPANCFAGYVDVIYAGSKIRQTRVTADVIDRREWDLWEEHKMAERQVLGRNLSESPWSSARVHWNVNKYTILGVKDAYHSVTLCMDLFTYLLL